MKVILYMAITPNGLIAKPDDDTGFVSDLEWRGFLKMMEKAGNNVMGRRTFEVSLKDGRFPYNVLNVVMTHKKLKNKWGDKVIFTAASPKKVVKMLEKQGFKIALVGGGRLDASFIKAGLVDELILDVEPTVFGKGINLFEGQDFNARLKLIGTKKLSKNEIQLHYKVLKR